jgi:hypothetical protein
MDAPQMESACTPSESDTDTDDDTPNKAIRDSSKAATASAPQAQGPSQSACNKDPKTSTNVPETSDYEKTRNATIAQNKIIMGLIDKSVDARQVPEVLSKELAAVGVKLTEDEIKAMLDRYCNLQGPLSCR